MDLSVVVVTFNGREMTLEGLRTLEAAAGGLAWELIVVDNGSADGSADAVATAFPSARVVRNPGNRGYGPAANQGMALATGRVVALVNNDARLPAGALASLVRFLDERPAAGIVGPRLVHEDGRSQHSFDVEPSLATELLNKSLLRRLFPGRYPSRLQERTEPFEVASLVGACFVAKRELLERLGRFDERFFYLYEETDLCLRARRAGAGVWLDPRLAVVHLQGRTRQRVRVRAKVEQARSRFLYFAKHHPGQHAVLRIVQPLKSLLESLIWLVPTLLTLGLWRAARVRFAESAAVLAWQFLGCPRSMGLSGA